MIPETIVSFGKASFKKASLINLTCLASIPPLVDDSFDYHDIFDGLRGDEQKYYNVPSYLFVEEEVYNRYVEEYGAKNYFTCIVIIGAEKTLPPTFEESIIYSHERAVQYNVTIHGEGTVYSNYEVYGPISGPNGWGFSEWDENNFYSTSAILECMATYMSVYAFAHEEGKLPSDPVGTSNDEGIWPELIDYGIDFIDDAGICYKKNKNDELAVVIHGLFDPCYINSSEGWVDPIEIIRYSGDVIIPSNVEGYKVTEVDYRVFEYCDSLFSIELPSTITVISGIYDCPNLKSITCLSPVPPECYYIDTEIYQNAVLYVPFTSIDVYRCSDVWSGFMSIKGVYNYDFEINGIYYRKQNNDEVMVAAGENEYQGDIIVPSNVSYRGRNYSVVGIDSYAFFRADINSLLLPVSIRAIENDAFVDCDIQSLYISGEGEWQPGMLPFDVRSLLIGVGITGVNGLQLSPDIIYSYETTPPVCNEHTFTDYSAELHVPASSLAAYFTAPYWCDFNNIIGDAVAVTEVIIDCNTLSLSVGDTGFLNATIKPDNAIPDNVSWYSSNGMVATVENGVINAIGSGECRIIATCQDKQSVCMVTVTEILPSDVFLNQESAKLEVGGQLNLIATVLPDSVTNKTVTWHSSNPSVAIVEEGLVTAISQGECDIFATCGNKQAICHIIVLDKLIYISLDQHRVILLPNHMVILKPTVTPVSTELIVSSSNSSVAAARIAGSDIQVVGVSEGIATVCVKSSDGFAEPDSCLIIVKTECGDVNCDGFVNISDVTALIDYLLSGDASSISLFNADCDSSGEVNISDVTTLIDFLLSGNWPEPAQVITSYSVNGVTFNMVEVDGGTFMMGATTEQGDGVRENEKPVHQVTLSDYNISQTEVTQELWQAVMGVNPSHHTGDLQRPVEQVSWVDCQEFIAKLNQLTGKSFRLPTEAEWEYAARGGNKSQGYMFAGSNDMDAVAWYTANSNNTTHPVGTKAPNELGLYDMTGNVWEWCYDWYARYTAEAQIDPMGPDTGNNRVLRGGCWNGGGNYNRISYRDNYTPTGGNSSGGLRLVLKNSETYTVNGVSFTMVPIRGGTFTMGATPEQAEQANDNEKPAHQVTISNYSIAQTEVTQELWQAVMGTNPSRFTGDPKRPVEKVSWDDCQAFIVALNAMTGQNFRLPTEAEWEFAARGGRMSQGYKYAGGEDLDEIAWYNYNAHAVGSSSPDYGTHVTATKAPNELGLYDMTGNVWEWCQDWNGTYGAEPQTNPTGPATGTTRVIRGGGWTNYPSLCRLSARSGYQTTYNGNFIGLRLAR